MKNFLIVGFVLFIAGSFTSCVKQSTPTPVTTIDSLRVGLLVYYQFNNSGADSSGKGNNVAYYQAITAATNRLNLLNSAFSFDGITSYLSVKDNSDLRLNNTDFTLNVWVNMKALNSNSGAYILSKRTSGINNGWGFSINGTQTNVGVVGGLYFGPGGGNIYAVSTKSITLNKWSMVTAVYSATKQQISFYIDGVLDNVSSNIATPSALITANLFIGSDNTSNNTSYVMNGALDDVRIYNRALTASGIQKLYISSN